MKQKSRPVVAAGVLLVFVAVGAGAAFFVFQNNAVTPEKLAAYVRSIDLSRLSPAERARVIARFADKVNALSVEDRRRWRRDGTWRPWFDEMSEDERGWFIDATLPSGLKQVIDSFENLSEATRKKSIDDALKHLQDTHQLPLNREPGQSADAYGTNGPPALSPQLEKKMLALGLKTFYSESSAQTKAEIAPLLEELQHQVERGRPSH